MERKNDTYVEKTGFRAFFEKSLLRVFIETLNVL